MTHLGSTTSIRQNYQNNGVNTYGLNVMSIISSPVNSAKAYYSILGSGTQYNRIYYYEKRNGILNTARSSLK